MSRKFILKGDTTDHGGVVLEGIANSSFDGRELAYLGAAVFCAACKSPGVIVSDGGGLSVISWAGHIMRCKGHGYANEEEKANCSASG
ncbi:PAAR domain-containing protein, partial [Burkholderia cenocepacia]|uniref:PAAR domain-containing protein n=1 Tax=Burkholderia cenocepacia TaxID=95486 RepID=UPI001F24B475